MDVVVRNFKPVMCVRLLEGYTVRWRRGDAVAYVFADQQTGEETTSAIDTIPVSRSGWTDITDVRQVATRWLRTREP